MLRTCSAQLLSRGTLCCELAPGPVHMADVHPGWISPLWAPNLSLSRQFVDMGTGTGLPSHHCLLRAKPRTCLKQILGIQGYMTTTVTSRFSLRHVLVTFLMVVSVTWQKTISGSGGLFGLIPWRNIVHHGGEGKLVGTTGDWGSGNMWLLAHVLMDQETSRVGLEAGLGHNLQSLSLNQAPLPESSTTTLNSATSR